MPWPRSRHPLETWLEASSRNRTPSGIETRVRRVPDGAAQEVWLPKEPVPYYVHAQVEFAGREPRFLAQTRRTQTEVCERYEFHAPCVLLVYKWTEERFFNPAGGEPRQRNVLYVCASEQQIARAKEVVAVLTSTPRSRLIWRG